MASDHQEITADNLSHILRNDISVKVAGIDVDGVLRGKVMAKKKFLSIAKDGFGFCSVIFGWDMHDMTYIRELKISNADNGYHDILAKVDLKSFRRIPWENNIPFFLVSFYDPDSGESVSACPRSFLGRALSKLTEKGYGAMAGGKRLDKRARFGDGVLTHGSRVRVLQLPVAARSA
jgi:glutamine synthetase